MKPGITAKSVALLFLAVLVLYLGSFYGLEHLRHRKGGWVAEFRAAPNGTPAFVVGKSTGNGVDGELVVGAMPFAMFDEKIKQVQGAK